MNIPQQVPIGFNATRICQAIARIGYEPQTALMDIVDNSVAALASDIRISLYLVPGKTLKNRNSVGRYQVVDNGIGMTPVEILRAFELGANGDYGARSLSKYGMGLKSAGLSLGTRIHIISKKSGGLSDRHTFDVDLIGAAKSFVVNVSPLTPAEVSEFGAVLGGDSGTVVEIDGCGTVNHQSPSTTVRKLTEQMGVVYGEFLGRKPPVRIWTRVCASDSPEFTEIHGFDILFRNQAKAWDPSTYDHVSPYLLLEEKWNPDLGDGTKAPPILLSAVGFPQDSLGGAGSPLTPEQQKIVRRYQVGRQNAGCFVYRNGRLIRWGDSLEGILTKDEFNLRVRMDLTEEHDDLLHVDVTKQRLEIDDELLSRLKRILEESKSNGKLIMKKCTELLKKPRGLEGAAFTELSGKVPEDDPKEMAAGAPSTEVLQRQQDQAAEADLVIEQSGSAGAEPASEDGSDLGLPFAKVRYGDGVNYGHLWTPYRDAKEGVFVCINMNHPFYTEFMADLADNSAERVLLEALIFAAGVGQVNTISNLDEVEVSEIKAVFMRFHTNCGTYLSNFTTENVNLLSK